MSLPEGENTEEKLKGKGALNSVLERDSNILMLLQNQKCHFIAQK